jgi:hypothetical protein
MPSFLSDINKNVKQTLQKRQKLFNYSFGDDVDYSYFEKFNQKTA